MIDFTTSELGSVPARLRQVATIISGAIVVVGLGMAARQGSEFVVTADQRGQRLFDNHQYQLAAEAFADPFRQAIAYYRAGEFKIAASHFAGLPGADAAFNRGNALVMLGEYEDAISSYDRALQLRSDWNAAETNREIARLRAARLQSEGGEMTGGKLAADEIVFDLNRNQSGGEEEVVQDGQQLSDEELRAMWLRQVQTTPSDFLKAKFAYQRAVETGKEGRDDD